MDLILVAFENGELVAGLGVPDPPKT